jgi:hypothetical protein
MHKQYLTNEEDIEFPKVSSAKQMPEISLELNTYGNWKYCHNFTWAQTWTRSILLCSTALVLQSCFHEQANYQYQRSYSIFNVAKC